MNGSSLFFEKSAFMNSAFIGTTLIAISAVIGGWLLDAEFEGKRSIEKLLGYGLLAYSAVALLGGFEIQIFQFEKMVAHGHLLATLSVITGMVFVQWATRLNWKIACRISLAYFALLLPAALLSFLWQDQLAQNSGYLLWPIALLAVFYTLRNIRFFHT